MHQTPLFMETHTEPKAESLAKTKSVDNRIWKLVISAWGFRVCRVSQLPQRRPGYARLASCYTPHPIRTQKDKILLPCFQTSVEYDALQVPVHWLTVEPCSPFGEKVYGWELNTMAPLPGRNCALAPNYMHCARWFHLYCGYFGFNFYSFYSGRRWRHVIHFFYSLCAVQTCCLLCLCKQMHLFVKYSVSLGVHTM